MSTEYQVLTNEHQREIVKQHLTQAEAEFFSIQLNLRKAEAALAVVPASSEERHKEQKRQVEELQLQVNMAKGHVEAMQEAMAEFPAG